MTKESMTKNSMKLTIKKSGAEKFVLVKVKGEITRERAMKNNIKAHEYGEKYGTDKYLVDLTEAKNTEGTIGNYKFAYEDMKNPPPPIKKSAFVAMVVAPNDSSHDFVEIVAQNSGLNVKKFTCLKTAENFLFNV